GPASVLARSTCRSTDCARALWRSPSGLRNRRAKALRHTAMRAIAVALMRSRPFGQCLVRGVALGGVLFAALACQSRTAADSGELRVVLHPAEGAARPAYVEIAGLTDDELSALRNSGLDEAKWASLLRVSVADQTDASLPAVAGRYAIAAHGVTFTPLFPFDAGRAYRVRFDASKLGSARTAILTSIGNLPGPAAARAGAGA